MTIHHLSRLPVNKAVHLLDKKSINISYGFLLNSLLKIGIRLPGLIIFLLREELT